MTAQPCGPLVVTCDWRMHEVPDCLLSPREGAHARRLDGPRRREWVRGRLTARAAIVWAGGSPGTELLPDAAGVPVAVAAGTTHPVAVSLSHTRELVACAVLAGAPAAVGVDIEPVDRRNDVLLRRILAAGDWDVVRRIPAEVRSSVVVSAKESALKAHRGHSLSLRDYRLARREDGRLTARLPGMRPPDLGPPDLCPPDLCLWPRVTSGIVTVLCAPASQLPEWRSVTPADVVGCLRATSGPVP
jgi:4'-phosphopantetheinyl transferase EntD